MEGACGLCAWGTDARGGTVRMGDDAHIWNLVLFQCAKGVNIHRTNIDETCPTQH